MVINSNKSKRITTQFRQGNKIIENPTEIANNFNNFFINVGSALLNKIPNSHKNPNDYIKISILGPVSLRLMTSQFKDVVNHMQK